MLITAEVVASLQPPPSGNRVVWATDVTGFGVRITAAGIVAFVLRYVLNGKERRFTIGKHPDLTPDEARIRAIALRGLISRGEDPMETRIEARRNPMEAPGDVPGVITGLVVYMAGIPRPKPRPRAIGGGRIVSLTGKGKAYAIALQRAASEAVSNIGGRAVVSAALGGRPLKVDVLACFPTPKAELWGEPYTLTPDKDNIEKMALDCLVKAGALGNDDSFAATGNTTKIWAERGSISITVRLAEASDIPTRPDQLDQAPAWLSSNLTDGGQHDEDRPANTTTNQRGRCFSMAKNSKKGKGGKC